MREYFTSISAEGSVNGKKWGRKRDSIIHFKEGLHEIDETAFEVTHMDTLLDDEPFDLMEHRRVGCVPVIAIDAAGHENADRRLFFHHRAHLHGAGMGAEHLGGVAFERLHEEGVVRFPGPGGRWGSSAP